jgi:hypothetical protein
MMLFLMLIGRPPFAVEDQVNAYRFYRGTLRTKGGGVGFLRKLLRSWSQSSEIDSKHCLGCSSDDIDDSPVVDLLGRMLCVQGQRMTASEVAAHPWFARTTAPACGGSPLFGPKRVHK